MPPPLSFEAPMQFLDSGGIDDLYEEEDEFFTDE